MARWTPLATRSARLVVAAEVDAGAWYGGREGRLREEVMGLEAYGLTLTYLVRESTSGRPAVGHCYVRPTSRS